MEKNIMEKIVETYNLIIERYDKFNPETARSIFTKINYIIITVANYERIKMKFHLKETTDINEVYSILVDIQLIDSSDQNFISSFIEENKDILQNLIDAMIDYKSVYDIFDLYENIISNDIVRTEYGYTVLKENKARDRSGAYYTSKEFASCIVKKVINDYLCNRLNVDKEEINRLIECKSNIIKKILLDVKYTDLSCGTGHFIIALVDYIEEIIGFDKDFYDFILNIYAFDVDFIAIQILRTELLIKNGDLNNAEIIKSRTILGNTLINVEETNYYDMLELISKGYIYHPQIGINQREYIEFFDIIIGNPPWEKIRFEDKNFFTNYCPRIANISKKNDREKEIDKLVYNEPNLKNYYDKFNSNMNECKKLIKNNELFENSAVKELNTYNLFTELSVKFLNREGYIALIVKSSLITSSANSKNFKFLIESNLIRGIYDFINKNKIFPIDSRERFSVLFLQKHFNKDFDLKMKIENISDFNLIQDTIKINKELLKQINPDTEMIPNISSTEELNLLIKFYNEFNVFEKEYKDCKYGRLVHLTNHASFIHKKQQQGTIPIYEGKFIERYDNKFSTFKNVSDEKKYLSKATAPEMSEDDKNKICEIPESRYFIDICSWEKISKNYNNKYSLYWRSLTSAKNKRTTIATILPHTPTIQSLQLLQCNNNEDLIVILALFNSAIFDFLVRLKLNGIDLTPTIIKQIPVPNKEEFEKEILFKGKNDSIKNHIFIMIKYLYRNDYRNHEIFKNIKIKNDGLELGISNKEAILNIDYLISKVYNLNKDELIDILKTFPKYYTKDDLEYIKNLK